MIVFLMGTISSAVTTVVETSTPLTKGESFTFTVSELSETSKINGTNYFIPLNTDFGMNPTMVITNVTKTNVYLNYTVNNKTKETTAQIDQFMSTCDDYYYYSAQNSFTGLPTSKTFAAPSNTSSTASSLTIMPMFASGNISYYNSQVPNATLAREQPSWSSYIINTNVVNSSVSGNIFKVSFNQSLTDAREIQTGSTNTSYSNTHALYFTATVDAAKHIVTDLYYKLTVDVLFGSATANVILIMHIVENKNTLPPTSNSQSNSSSSSSGTKTKNTPGYEFLFAISSLTTLVLLRKKKRN